MKVGDEKLKSLKTIDDDDGGRVFVFVCCFLVVRCFLGVLFGLNGAVYTTPFVDVDDACGTPNAACCLLFRSKFATPVIANGLVPTECPNAVFISVDTPLNSESVT